MSIHTVQGDICQASCDVIVNASNGIGFMGGLIGLVWKCAGVAESIHYATRGKVEREAILKCLRHYIIGYMPGSVFVTGAYNLNCRFILHAVTMYLPGTFSTLGTVRRLLPKILQEARSLGARTIAIPLLGTGVGRLKPEKVMALYEEAFSGTDDVDVFVYTL